MKILAIDSSCAEASAALILDECKVFKLCTDGTKKHSETLLPLIEKLLEKASLNLENVELFACTVGPGSFTGTRIAVSVVKGLALSKNVPCVGLSTLEVLANNVLSFDGIVCPVMSARRDTYYNAFFEAKDGKLTRLCNDRQIFVADLMCELEKSCKPIIFLGDGAKMCYNHVLENDLKIDASVADEDLLKINPEIIAKLASESKNVTNAENLNTLYIKPTEAERNINIKN